MKSELLMAVVGGGISAFDLDQSTINSNHRTLPAQDKDGNLDLNKYRALATHDNIMKDKELPLAEYMRQLIAAGQPVAIITARHLNKSDYVYLRQRGLKPSIICSRDQLFKKFDPVTAKLAYYSRDAEYKRLWLQYLQSRFGLDTPIKLYDDHKGVLKMAKTLGVQAIDAVQVNAYMLDLWEQGYNAGLMDAEDQVRIAVQCQQFDHDHDLYIAVNG